MNVHSGKTNWWQRHLPKMTLALLAAMIAAMVYLFLQTTANERKARAESVAMTEILADLRDVVRTGVDAETGSRGYILTEDRVFLEPYERARKIWIIEIDRLRGRFEADGDEENVLAVDRIRDLAEKKLTFMENVVRLTAEGQRDVAIAEVKTQYGKLLLDNVRQTVREIEAKERQKMLRAVERANDIEYRIVAILVGLLALVIMLAAFGFQQERKASRAALLDQEAFLLRQGKEQADLIAQELNHRVKNLFAVILSLITLSARGSTDVPTTIEKIRNRIHALSLAHSVSQGTSGIRSVDIRDLFDATLAPYRNAHDNIVCDGPHITLSTATITPLGLIVHELATNALKYGALSQGEGSVAVTWDCVEQSEGKWVSIDWREAGGPASSGQAAQGFGSSMITASAQQLNGTLEQHWHSDGLEVKLGFPLI
ncbi:MAG: CHASE3 domain-containing protein [Sphingomonadaceae bacterium]|nr:CHASE3 domain-containing protein [Sphingomonadaceae bacterium]